MLRTKEHECKEITPAETPSYYNTADKITSLIHATLKEAKYIITIVMDLNVIPLALQITCLAGKFLISIASISESTVTIDERKKKYNR